MTRPPDRVEIRPLGISHLPAEFREVARLANLAGIEGYRVEDVEIRTDWEGILTGAVPPTGELRTYITITYREKAE